MSAVPVYISQTLYDKLRSKAEESHHSPEELVEDLLKREFEHPYIVIEKTRFGERSVIKDTHVTVASIVSYHRLGIPPEKIARDVLTHLELSQVQAALDYYADHKDEIDR